MLVTCQAKIIVIQSWVVTQVITNTSEDSRGIMRLVALPSFHPVTHPFVLTSSTKSIYLVNTKTQTVQALLKIPSQSTKSARDSLILSDSESDRILKLIICSMTHGQDKSTCSLNELVLHSDALDVLRELGYIPTPSIESYIKLKNETKRAAK